MAKEKNEKLQEEAIEQGVTTTEVEVVEDENVYRLKKPLPGLPESFVFDLENLSGKEIIKAERRYNNELAKQKRNGSLMQELSKEYLAFVVAAVIGWKPEDVLEMGARDFTALTTRAQYFLLNM